MTAQALFSGGEHEVNPGESLVLQLSVANLGDSTETFSLAPAGFAASWVTVRPATITLFGGTHQNVEVEVRPPRVFSTTPGATALSVRVVPLGAPDDVATAETRLVIGSTFDRQLTVLQPALRARRRAVFEAMLENHGNTQASCRLHLIDPTGRVDADFDPPSLGVEPGANAVVRMKLRAGRLQWDRRARTIPFIVDADQPNVSTVSSAATFVQAPVLPERLYPRLAAVAAVIAALAASWFAFVRPAIDRAVDRAVDDRPPVTVITPDNTGVPVTVPDPAQSVPDSTTPPTVTTPTGTPVVAQLTATVAAAASQTVTFDVPPGQNLQITDLLLQNPGVDEGRVTLRTTNSGLYNWNLAFVTNNETIRLNTPIVVPGGQQLLMDITCLQPGETANGGCVPAITMSGLLFPAS